MLKFKKETEFKETEIGKIPRDWEIDKLKKEYSVIMGQSPKSKYYNKEGKGIFFIQGNKEFQELYVKPELFTSKCHKIAPSKSVLITVRAPIGNVNLTLQEICIGRGVAAIFHKTKEIMKNRFCYYLLKGLEDYILSFGEGGTTYESITKSDLENLEIPLPPPPEQSRIATVLSWFDDLIENKKQQNEILEKTAMAIFKSWFVDFDPFRNEEFLHSEELDRKVPKGWEVQPIGEVANVIMGQSPPSKYYNQSEIGLPFIQGKGQFGQRIPQTEVFCSENIKIAKTHDILITVRAPVGELNIAEREYVIGRGVASLKFDFWPYLYLHLLFDKRRLKSYVRGTTYEAITKEELESFCVLYPPQPILQKFHRIVEPLFEKIINNQKEIMVLRKIRDALLPQLVFGKLRVVEL